MTLNSVNTNVAAMIALQGLNKTNEQLQTVQSRVSTGFRVASAKDDGAAFSIAQGLRADSKGYEAVSEQLSKAKGTMSVANDAAKQISNTLSDVKAVVLKLADENTSGDERTQYIAQYESLKTQITTYISDATFGGINLLNTGTGVNVISDIAANHITLPATNLSTGLVAKLTTITDAASAKALLTASSGGVDVAEAAIGTAMASMGDATKSLDNQIDYVSVLQDATDDGIGSIVDADLAKESAKLQALQIRQQLATQSLSIANQGPNILLSLFKS